MDLGYLYVRNNPGLLLALRCAHRKYVLLNIRERNHPMSAISNIRTPP